MDQQTGPYSERNRGYVLRVLSAGLLGACLLLCGCAGATVSLSPLMMDYRGKSVAVVDVTAQQKKGMMWTLIVAGRINVNESRYMASSLERALVELGFFKVIDGSSLDRIVAQRGLEKPGLIDTSSAVQLGRLVGLDGVVVVDSMAETGWLVPFGEANFVVRAKLIDVKTENVVWAAEGTYDSFTVYPVPLLWAGINTAYNRVGMEVVRAISSEYRLKTRAKQHAENAGFTRFE